MSIYSSLTSFLHSLFRMFNLLDSLIYIYMSICSLVLVYQDDLLCFVIDDLLPDQKNESLKSIMINDEDEWKIDNILNSRWYWRWLQYKVKWNDYNNDLNWYNADDDEFMNTQKIVDDFHIQYSNKSR